ncbi:MAG: RDD family protein, partial [Coriobacteriia bacterium]|nr:RDD family protein [Coriobacteriia bacterium]
TVAALGRMLEIGTPEAVTVTYPLAGIGSRGAAALIDLLMLGLLMLAETTAGALVLFVGVRFFGFSDALPVWGIALLVVALFVTYWGYFIYGEVVRNGRTFGKRRMRIRVVRDDGSRVGVLDSVIRNVVRIVDALPGTYAVGVACLLISPRARRLGDMAAGTVVIAEPDELGQVPGADKRESLAGEYLTRRAGLTPDARYQVGVAVLELWGEVPGTWDEPTIAGRIADLSGLRGRFSGAS